jgi:outer membrane protein assembly factor BamB
MKRVTRSGAFWLVLSALALGGCSAIERNFLGGEDNREKPAELEPLDAVPFEVDTLWSASVGSGDEKQFLQLTPVVAEGRVFAAQLDGTVAAYDAATGERLWAQDTNLNITGGPGTDGDVVVVGTDNGEVAAMLAGGGDRLWQVMVSSEVLSAPQIADDVVVVRTIDGKLFGLDKRTGKRKWIYDRSVPVLTLRGTGAPAVARGLAVNGFDSGRLVAVDLLDGQTVWEARLAVPRGRSELERLVDIDAGPVIVDNTVFAVTYQGRIAALDLLSGDLLWQRDMSSYTGLSFDNDLLYVTDADSQVWAFDRINSASTWRMEKLRARGLTAPAVLGVNVIVGDVEGYVHWLSREDGRQVSRVKVGSAPIFAQPIVANGICYIYDSDGNLSALKPGGS